MMKSIYFDTVAGNIVCAVAEGSKLVEYQIEKTGKTQIVGKGGAVVCYGPVECNCSLEMIFAQLRRELEGEVCEALFDFRGNGI